MHLRRATSIGQLLAVAAIGLAVGLPSDGGADHLSSGVRLGVVIGDSDSSFRLRIGSPGFRSHRPYPWAYHPGAHRFGPPRRAWSRSSDPVEPEAFRRDHWHGQRFNPYFAYPRYGYVPGYTSQSSPAYAAQPPEAQVSPPDDPPVAAAPVEPAGPPDPRGPRRVPARGTTIDEAPFTIGEALPSNLPHVALDWRLYDLPEPPAGRIYARVGRDVLLITADDRIVEEVVEL